MYNPSYKRYHCDNPEWYDNPKLNQFIDNRLALFSEEQYPPEGYGDVETTVHQAGLLFRPFKQNAEELFAWVEGKIKESGDFFFGKEITKVRVVRFWFNRMKKGSKVGVHDHINKHLVAVFYPRADIESAMLTLVENGSRGTFVEDYPEERLAKIPAGTGDLLIHRGPEFHGVTEYLKDDIRICFVFDVMLEFA